MENNNKKMLIVLGVLLLLGGISFAYFVGTSLFNGTGSKTEGITASIKGATVNVEGGLAFNDLDILPGHQTISSIKVTATGNNELIPYNLIWNGTNSLNTPLEFKVYKTSKEVDVIASCDKKTKVENGYQILNEECSISNLDKLGELISSGTIETATNTTKVILAEEEFITATSDGMSVYYYVILEYPNLDEEQNEDMGGTFEGTVTVEESNAKPDINILAVKLEQEDGTYQDSDDIPQSGYILNTEKSVCTNNAFPNWSDNKLIIENLTKKGTSCYLYFKESKGMKAILANITLKDEIPDFSKIADTDEGVFKAKDDDGDTYYFRGAVKNNYVKYAGFYWRIIRINGDGTIRLIYQGTSAAATDANAQVGISKFNPAHDDNMYVGFKYAKDKVHGIELESTILTKLNAWYEKNLKNYESKIDSNAGFCNDREPSTSQNESDGQGGIGTTTTYYGARVRLYLSSDKTSATPTFKCQNESDLFTKEGANKGNKSLDNPIGLITADEAVFAGGLHNKSNSSYYLYTGQSYWTMSPTYLSSFTEVYRVLYNGECSVADDVYDQYGIRPVINLRADTEFKFVGTSEKGTMNNPYIVVDAE